MGGKVLYLWGLPSPQKAGPDSSEALGLGSQVPRHHLGPLVGLLMLLGEAPLHLHLQEQWAEQIPGFLSPPPLWGRGPSARPGAWAALPGGSGHCRSQPPQSARPRQCSPSLHASCRPGSPEKVVPASPRCRPRQKGPPEVWPGGLLSEGQYSPPLSLSAAQTAGSRAGPRPWSPGEWSCHRLPPPDVAPTGPGKHGRHTGSGRDPGPPGFAAPA